MPKGKKPNASDRQQLKAAELRLFVRATGRKAQKRTEPNDRPVDRRTTDAVRHMRPEDFDRLLRDGEDC
jgi:hypothetical protein